MDWNVEAQITVAAFPVVAITKYFYFLSSVTFACTAFTEEKHALLLKS